jgi:hypothetical protein
MTIAGWILVATGALASLALWAADLRRIRATEPYAATGRLAPELHLFAALLTGVGAALLIGWLIGLGVGVGHLVAGIAVALWIEKSA